MKAVSNAYKQSMRSLLRGRSFARITFENIDASAATDGTWTANSALPWSETETLDYPYNYPPPVATLEPNRWMLDGNSRVLIDNPNAGYVSSQITDVTGEFDSAPVLTRSFSAPHDLVGLTLSFEDQEFEYPKSITVQLSGAAGVLSTITAYPTGRRLEIDTQEQGVTQITVTFGDMLPNRRARLESVLYGLEVIFENDSLVSVRQSNEVDPISRRLPQENLSFTILDYEHHYDPDNPSGVYAYIDEKAPIQVEYGYQLPSGDIEWLKADKYLLTGRPSVRKNQVTFTGTGLIGSLNGIYYKSKLGSKSLYDMAVSVLEDAGLQPTPDGGDPWDIDESLKDMTTTAVLPIATHKNCLQLIAHAARCRLYTDDDNIIHITPFGVTVRGIYAGEWSDNGHAPYSDWDSVDTGGTSSVAWVTLEQNRWVLSGKNQVVLPDTAPGHGYASSMLTDQTGDFSTQPVVRKEFEVEHDLPVLLVQFDSVVEDYPSSITVTYYDESDQVIDTQTVDSIQSSDITVHSVAQNCKAFQITAIGRLPYRRFRIAKVYYRETDFSLDFTTIREESQQISKIDKLKAVSVAKYGYSAAEAVTPIYTTTTDETEFHVEFSRLAQDVSISVEGGSLLSSEIYGRAADLVLSSGQKTITISGKAIEESSTVVTYPVAAQGEVDVEQNPLITSDTMCAALASHIQQYLTMRNTYDAQYRGNPELEVGDIIGLQTEYTSEMDAIILRDELTFQQSLSGRLKVKGLI